MLRYPSLLAISSLFVACQLQVSDDESVRTARSSIVNGESAAAYPYTSRLSGDLLGIVDWQICTGTVVSVCPAVVPPTLGPSGDGGSAGSGGSGGAVAGGGGGAGTGGTAGSSGSGSGGTGASTSGPGLELPVLPPRYAVLTAGHCNYVGRLSRMKVNGHALSKVNAWTHPQFLDAIGGKSSTLWESTAEEELADRMLLAAHDVGLLLMSLDDPSRIPNWTQADLPGPFAPKASARLVGYGAPGGGVARLQNVGGTDVLWGDLVSPALVQFGDSGGPWYVGSKVIASVNSVGRVAVEVEGETHFQSVLGPKLTRGSVRTPIKQQLRTWGCETGSW